MISIFNYGTIKQLFSYRNAAVRASRVEPDVRGNPAAAVSSCGALTSAPRTSSASEWDETTWGCMGADII